MDDNSLMKFGMHQGKRLADVPDAYLLWLYENDKAHGALRTYIADNLDSIKVNIGKPVEIKR